MVLVRKEIAMPKSIKYFELLWLGSLVIGAFMVMLTWEFMIAMQVSKTFIIFILIFVFVIMLALILLTSRKRSNIAKWVLVAFFVVGFIPYIPQLIKFYEMGLPGYLSTIQVLMQFAGVLFLFSKNGRDWFNKTIS